MSDDTAVDATNLPPGYDLVRFYVGSKTPILNFGFKGPDGKRRGSHPDRSVILDRAEAHYRKSQHRKRPCICCRNTFVSEGVGNRMCPICRKKPEGLI